MKRITLLVALLSLTGCKSRTDDDSGSSQDLDQAASTEPDPAALRASPLLAVLTPAEGINAERADLGNRLYHDTRLSVDGTLSCASCHNINTGGDDDRAGSLGVGG
ncbi:MAG: cytochrome c peroxidase [Bradymonadia bacterium]|jgi:cytochrome c peroxidase